MLNPNIHCYNEQHTIKPDHDHLLQCFLERFVLICSTLLRSVLLLQASLYFFIFTYEGRRGSCNLWDDETFLILPCVPYVLACSRWSQSYTGRAILLLTSVDLGCWGKRNSYAPWTLKVLNSEFKERHGVALQTDLFICFFHHLFSKTNLFLSGTKHKESCQMPKHKKSLDCENKERSCQNMHSLVYCQRTSYLQVQEERKKKKLLPGCFSHSRNTFRWSWKQNSTLKLKISILFKCSKMLLMCLFFTFLIL